MISHNGFTPNYFTEFGEETTVNKSATVTSLTEEIIIKEIAEKNARRKVKYNVMHALTVAIIVLSMITVGVGVFDMSEGTPHNFTNQYGDTVKIYGKGLYRHDSFFRAPIFRGTDFTMLFIACPLLIFVLIQNIRGRNTKSIMLLASVITCFMYYAASVCFGVTYNWLQLVYIMLFAACFFGLISGMVSIDFTVVEQCDTFSLPYKGVYRFLIITGIALFAACLPDIVTSLIVKRPLLMIENYTTEITYVIDMGIVAPACFICYYLLKHRKGLGYVLLDMLLTLCIIIGIMLPAQTIFQFYEGITIPITALITKLGSFFVLAFFALYFKIQSARNIAAGVQQS